MTDSLGALFSSGQSAGGKLFFDSIANEWRPGTGDVLSAFGADAFKGTGTFAAALRASEIEAAEGRLSVTGPASIYQAIEDKITGRAVGKRISEQEWKQSKNYRNGLSWYDGMTEESAGLLAQNHDDQAAREYVTSRSTNGQAAMGFGVSLVGGIFEPYNAISGIAIAGATSLATANPVVGAAAGLGRIGAPVARALTFLGGRGARSVLTRAAFEGAASAAVLEPGNWQTARTLQQEYDVGDTVFNIATSVAFSGLIEGARSFVDYRRGIRDATFRRVTEAEANDTMGLAAAQLAEGRKVDVSSVGDYYRAKNPETPEAKWQKAVEKSEDIIDYMAQQRGFEVSVPSSVRKGLGLEKQPRSLSGFLKEGGGIKDPQGAIKAAATRGTPEREATAAISKRDGGMTIKQAKETAIKRGYFPEHKTADTLSDSEFIGAIVADAQGRRRYDAEVRQKIDEATPDHVKKLMERFKVQDGMTTGELASALQPYQEYDPNMNDLAYIPQAYVRAQVSAAEAQNKAAGTMLDNDSSLYDGSHDGASFAREADRLDFNERAEAARRLNEADAIEAEVRSAREQGFLSKEDEDLLEELDDEIARLDDEDKIYEAGVNCILGAKTNG